MVKDVKGTETNSTIEIMKEGQIVYTIYTMRLAVVYVWVQIKCTDGRF